MNVPQILLDKTNRRDKNKLKVNNYCRDCTNLGMNERKEIIIKR